jgi:hypothetical protein
LSDTLIGLATLAFERLPLTLFHNLNELALGHQPDWLAWQIEASGAGRPE